MRASTALVDWDRQERWESAPQNCTQEPRTMNEELILRGIKRILLRLAAITQSQQIPEWHTADVRFIEEIDRELEALERAKHGVEH